MAEGLPTIGNDFAGVPLVGTASTFYKDPNDVRFEVALETAEAFRNEGIPYVVVDASPGTWVAQAHWGRGAQVLGTVAPGIATQRQQGVNWAVQHGAEKVVGLEPEKPTIPQFAGQISAALDNNDVLFVGRTKKALESASPVQQRTEKLAGWILEQTHQLPPDALAGPRGFTRAGAEILAGYPSNLEGMNNWLYLYYTAIEARRQGLPIGGIAVDMIYPDKIYEDEYKEEAFHNKRMDQFTMQMRYLLGEGLDALHMAPGSEVIAWMVRGSLTDLEAVELPRKYQLFSILEQTLSSLRGYELPEDWWME